MVANFTSGSRPRKDPFDFGLDIRPGPPQLVAAHLIEPLHFQAVQRREEDGLHGYHPEVTHELNRVRREVTAAAIHMPTDHRHKDIVRGLPLKEVRGSKLGMVRHRVCPTHFEFNPEAAASGALRQDHIRPWGTPEDCFQLLGQEARLRLAIPAWWTISPEPFLQVAG
jgi:hypothetical protein